MGQFNHPNVIALKGVVTQSRFAVILQAAVNDCEEHCTFMAKPRNFKPFLCMSRCRGRRLRARATPRPLLYFWYYVILLITQMWLRWRELLLKVGLQWFSRQQFMILTSTVHLWQSQEILNHFYPWVVFVAGASGPRQPPALCCTFGIMLFCYT